MSLQSPIFILFLGLSNIMMIFLYYKDDLFILQSPSSYRYSSLFSAILLKVISLNQSSRWRRQSVSITAWKRGLAREIHRFRITKFTVPSFSRWISRAEPCFHAVIEIHIIFLHQILPSYCCLAHLDLCSQKLTFLLLSNSRQSLSFSQIWGYHGTQDVWLTALRQRPRKTSWPECLFQTDLRTSLLTFDRILDMHSLKRGHKVSPDSHAYSN